MYSLKDKVIVISGASSGIGEALAKEVLKRGAKVAVCARSVEKLSAAYKDVDAEQVLLCKTDVSMEEDCKALINAVFDKWGRIDALINNAGISMRALFDETELPVIKELMDINFWGTVYCTKYALPYIRKQNGIIAGISSVAGYRGLPGRTGYSASKFAMQGFLEALRTELLHTGTHVMWLCPGFTASNIRNTARDAHGGAQGETPLNESKLMSAETCAGIIADAMEKRKRNVIMTTQGKAAVWINRLFGAWADKIVYKHFLKEPGSPLKKYEQ